MSPTRTCAGCGRKSEQAGLIRFAAPEGLLTPGRREPGRGAYTCRSIDCFEQARASRGFERTLRRQVRVDPVLARLYTGAH